MNVLDGNFLLAFAPVPVESFQKRGVGAREFIGLAEASTFKSLIAYHGAAIAFHRGIVAGDHLRGDHALKFIGRIDAHQSIDRSTTLLPAWVPAYGTGSVQPSE
jgi:hypothetical protein